MGKRCFFVLLLSLSISTLFSRSMEFTSCKTYAKVEKNLVKAEEFGLLALDIEPENSYIPYFIGKFIYRPQKKRVKAGKMFVEALNRPNTKIENPFRIGKEKQWVETVHDAISLFGGDWYNYGVESIQSKDYDDAIENFNIASKLDKSLTGKCYRNIAEIYYSKQETDKAIEFIDIALKETDQEQIILDLNISKATYLRKMKRVDEAYALFNTIPEENLTLNAKYELFLIHMDKDDCNSAINIGSLLFATMEEDSSTPMSLLSELAFNIAACYNQKADKIYNELIDYIGAENHTNDLTQFNLEQCEQSKEYYSQAKDYYRLSLDYDETPSESTKAYKKKMRANIRKVDDQLIPTLEGLSN